MIFFFPEALLVLPSKGSHLLKSWIFIGLLDLKLLFLPEEYLTAILTSFLISCDVKFCIIKNPSSVLQVCLTIELSLQLSEIALMMAVTT